MVVRHSRRPPSATSRHRTDMGEVRVAQVEQQRLAVGRPVRHGPRRRPSQSASTLARHRLTRDSGQKRSRGAYFSGMEAPTPLVLIDVDGVLNPRRSSTDEYRRQWAFPGGLAHRLLLNPRHGRMLTDLAEVTGAELVWATYWRGRANTWIAPRIGLPSLRFVSIPTRLWLRPSSSLGLWKARHVAASIGQTPFVWFEDDPSVPRHLAEQPGLGQHLVVAVDPAVGLTHDHVEQARTWLHNLRPIPDRGP